MSRRFMRGKGGSQRLSARGIYLTPLRPFWPCGGQIICDTRKVADVDGLRPPDTPECDFDWHLLRDGRAQTFSP